MFAKHVAVVTVILLSAAVASLSFAQEAVIPMDRVFVASRHLDQQTILTEKDLKVERWPANIVPEDAVGDLKLAVGKRLVSRTSKGMPLVTSGLQDANAKIEIPIGKKVVALKLRVGDGAVGMLIPGDWVDVIGVYSIVENGKKSQGTKTILSKVQVFSLSQNNQQPAGTVSDERETIAALLVSNEQAEQLFLAKKESGQIKLVILSNPTDNSDQIFHANSADDTDAVRRTREIARQLDQLAADLEDLRQFENADSLRESAHKLRSDVR